MSGAAFNLRLLENRFCLLRLKSVNWILWTDGRAGERFFLMPQQIEGNNISVGIVFLSLILDECVSLITDGKGHGGMKVRMRTWTRLKIKIKKPSEKFCTLGCFPPFFPIWVKFPKYPVIFLSAPLDLVTT